MSRAYLVTEFTGLLPVLTVAFTGLLAALAVAYAVSARTGAWRRLHRRR
jgi:hypothetical protein